MDATMKEVARKIWELCGECPEYGNAVMDLIGEEAYIRVMRAAAGKDAKTTLMFDPDARVGR